MKRKLHPLALVMIALALVGASCGGDDEVDLAETAPAAIDRIVAAFDAQDMTVIPDIVGNGVWVDLDGREHDGLGAEEYLTPLAQRISAMALTGEEVVTEDRHAYQVVETVGTRDVNLWFIISFTDDGELRIAESWQSG
ncbi:MAG: hypothetical protein AAF480_01595 [Actinomycetota bacterium]